MLAALLSDSGCDIHKLREKLADLVEWKNITVQGYGHEPVSVDEMYAWLEKYAFPWREYLCNTTEYLSAQADAGTRRSGTTCSSSFCGSTPARKARG